MTISGKAVRRMRTIAAVSAALTIGATTAAPASAAPLPGPSAFARGLTDENLFQSPVPGVRARWFARGRSVGSTWVRMRANWYLIAPTVRPKGFRATNPADRAYDFTSLDASVRSASASGTHVLLELIGAPTWAEGARMPASAETGSWKPNATDLGQFARALALRYDGHFPDPLHRGHVLPRVSTFQIWNEPNLPIYITPQWTRLRHGWAPASPGIYRAMLNAGYAAIKSVQPHALVAEAGTAPYGDPPGVDRMHPAVFLASLLCESWPALKPLRCPHPAHFDILDHHPYSLSPYISAYNAADAGVPDIGRLQRIVRAAVRTGRLLPRGPKPTWITEVSWDSNPPDRGQKLTQAGQARYAGYALYSLWRQGVSNVFWFQFQDIDITNYLEGSGLYSMSGVLKPAGREFAFPFVAGHSGTRDTLWSLPPHAGAVTVQVRRRGRWRTLLVRRTTRGGVLYAVVREPRGLLLRAVQGRAVSPSWRAG